MYMDYQTIIDKYYAVDADGSGSKSLIGSMPDSFASAANFLKAMGWKEGQIFRSCSLQHQMMPGIRTGQKNFMLSVM